jgi:hypothetical protein
LVFGYVTAGLINHFIAVLIGIVVIVGKFMVTVAVFIEAVTVTEGTFKQAFLAQPILVQYFPGIGNGTVVG